jgi:mannose-1-phosphate guanylyltransferase
MKIYAVIMAGGVGSRFWPRSTEKRPKQLLKIFGDKTMIQSTVDRINDTVDNENIFIITNKIQKPEIVSQLSSIPKENIIEEPFGRNTAACIGLASLIVQNKQDDGVMIVLPADHIIRDVKAFNEALNSAVNFAYQSKGLVTIGITPTRPETGYGYIQIEEKEEDQGIHKVSTFAEKPNYSTAVRFLESGDFFWNSGMFIWRADSIMEEIQMLMPELYEGLIEIKRSLGQPEFDKILANVYGKLRSISIDYGIMEKSQKVYLTKGNFVWSDVGSWEEVYQLSQKDENGNVKTGNVYTDMVVDSYIYSPDKFASVIGVDNLIIINTENALLICRRDQAQNVKKIVDHLKINKLTDYL